MGILQRFSDIMASNINAALDNLEDPGKMVDQYIRNLEKDLSQVKKETASVMAEEKRVARELKENEDAISNFMALASKAVSAGNDEDAKKFIEKKNSYVGKKAEIEKVYEVAKENANKMRQMHDKLVKDLNELNERKQYIKSKASMAKTQKNINKMTEAMGSASGTMSNFDRLEKKADKMLDEASAMSELNLHNSENSMKELTEKYSNSTNEFGQTVDDELAALKNQLGMLPDKVDVPDNQ